jgi:hypothetical protein
MARTLSKIEDEIAKLLAKDRPQLSWFTIGRISHILDVSADEAGKE